MISAVVRFSCAGFLLAAWAGAQTQQAPWLEHRIERIADGFRYVGGIAWSREGHLYISDGPRGRIQEYTPGQPAAMLPVDLKNPSGLAVDDHGRLLVCEAGARRIVRIKAGNSVEVLATAFDGHALNSPNDLVVRKDGTIFFTDPAFGSAADSMELPFHGLFRLNGRNEAVVLARWKSRPNGVALSPDGKTLYVAMSDERAIRAFDLDRQGNVSNERILVSGIGGVPNALRTDDKGRLYLAAHMVQVYSPEGKPLGQVEIHERPTSLAFGDTSHRILFVATRTSVYRVEFDQQR